MNKQSIIACLFFIFILPHSSYSSETPQAYLRLGDNQSLLRKNSVKNIFEACIGQAVPIVVPAIGFGKFIANWIKNKRNNKTKRKTPNQPYVPIKKQEPIYYPTVTFTPPMKTYEGSINVNLKSNIIKKFNNIENMKEHIFSKNHIEHGIFNLGKNEDDIVDKFVKIIKLSDHKNLLKHGPNQIHTIINNHKAVIRAFIEESKVLKINGFIEDNVNKIGNVFELLVKEYQYGQKIIN